MNDYCVECGGPLQVPTLDPTSGVYSHSDSGECVRTLRRQRETLMSENAAWRKRTDQAEAAITRREAEVRADVERLRGIRDVLRQLYVDAPPPAVGVNNSRYMAALDAAARALK